MTMAPKEASDEQIHKVFGTLKELRDLVQAKGYAHAPCNGSYTDKCCTFFNRNLKILTHPHA